MMTEAERAAIEKRIGRRLTDMEVIRGGIERAPVKGPQPVNVKSPAQLQREALLQHVAEAQKAVDDEAYSKLSPAQRKLQDAKKIVLDAMAHRKRYDEMRATEERLKNPPPEVKAQLARLDELERSVAFDANWDYEQFSSIDAARRALGNADMAEAMKSVDAVFAIKTAKDKAAANDMRIQAVSLEQQLAALRGNADSLDPPQEKPKPRHTQAEADAAFDIYWGAKKAHGEDSEPAKAALSVWEKTYDGVETPAAPAAAGEGGSDG